MDEELMDVETRLVEANVRRRLFDEGFTRVGRYRVDRRIGRGGMGVVFSGWDDDLERPVALKLLRADHGRKQRERLRREAQALAKLSHPNVVQIYGVEEIEGRLCLALEMVDGQDLRAYLRTHQPSQREILDLFIQAGRGLAAAHRAGLVHRDFKPGNVLVDRSGRARVTDFGTVTVQTSTEEVPDEENARTHEGTWHHLTRTGASLGTPLYMSPEQHAGLEVDVRSDIYSFCLALWESLAGTHPFYQGGLRPMLLRMESRSVRPAAMAKVPARLRKILLEGLHPNPHQRPDDLELLLDALVPRRRGWAALGVSGMVGAVGVTAWLLGSAVEPPCEGVGNAIDEQWNDVRRERVDERFSLAPQPYAPDAARAAREGADGWAQRWKEARSQTCQAHPRDTPVDTATHDARVTCLDDLRRDFGTLLDLVEEGQGAALLQAPGAISSLPDPEECTRDTRPISLGALVSPDDPDLVAATDELLRARAERRLGRYRQAIERLEALERSRDWTDHPVLRAELLLERGAARSGLVDPKAPEDLQLAIDLAEAHRADRLAATGWIRLAAFTAVETLEVDRADDWFRRAHAAVARLDDDPVLVSWLRLAEGSLAARRGDFARAEVLFDEARAMRVELGPGYEESIGRSLHARAEALVPLGRAEEALTLLRQARDVQRVLGEAHPFVADIEITRGEALHGLGRLEESEAAFVHAAELLATMGGQEKMLGEVERGLTRLALDRGQMEVARRHAASAYERLAPRGGALAHDALCTLGSLELLTGNLERSHEHLERCAQAQAQLYGDRSQPHGEALNNLGEAELALGQYESALLHFRRARELLRNAPEEFAFLVGYPEKGEGLVLLARAQVDQALPLLESAYQRLASADGVLTPDLADLAFGLARARALSNAPLEDFVPLAVQATLQFRNAGNAEAVARVEQFLSEYETPPPPRP